MRFSLKNVFSIFSLKNVFPLLSLFMLIACSPPLPPIPPPPFAHFDISTLDQFVDFNACPECPRDKIRIRILEDTYNDPDQCPIKKGFLNKRETNVLIFIMNDDRYFNHWVYGLELIMCSKSSYTPVNVADNEFFVPLETFNDFLGYVNDYYRKNCNLYEIQGQPEPVWLCPHHLEDGDTPG